MRFLVLLLLGCLPAFAAAPNVVFIFIDDMGYGDLSVTGNSRVETQHIDRLAAEGLRFTQFYVGSPICSPSRVAITTGQYPARWLINSYLNTRRRNRERGMADFLSLDAPAVARAFQQAGYATAHFGKWHMGGGRDVHEAPTPQAYGFDESLVSFEGLGERILPPGGLSERSALLGAGPTWAVAKHMQTPIYVDRSIDFIRRHREQPFYLHLWLNDVHDRHSPSPEQAARYARLSDDPYLRDYYAVLDAMDEQIGRLIDAIDSMGLAENTLIALTSDNGPTAWPRYYEEGYEPPGSTAGFRGRKWSLYEGGIRMPFIARWKGKIPAGRLDETTILGAVDLLPTFCAMAGVEPPRASFDGLDMSAAMRGRPQMRSRPLYWEYGRDETYLQPGEQSDRSPNLAVRDGRWKLLMNADGSRIELYDFDASTDERDNVAAQYKGVTTRLSRMLLNWRRSLPEL